MYKVYRDPEGKNVMPTQQSANFTFQCSEDKYKEQIEKLREENVILKKKVRVWFVNSIVMHMPIYCIAGNVGSIIWWYRQKLTF